MPRSAWSPGTGAPGSTSTLSGAPKHGWCSLVARAADGRSEIAATWPADGFGRVDVSGSTAIPAAQLSELSVVTDTGRRLVSIPVPHQNASRPPINQQEETDENPHQPTLADLRSGAALSAAAAGLLVLAGCGAGRQHGGPEASGRERLSGTTVTVRDAGGMSVLATSSGRTLYASTRRRARCCAAAAPA